VVPLPSPLRTLCCSWTRACGRCACRTTASTATLPSAAPTSPSERALPTAGTCCQRQRFYSHTSPLLSSTFFICPHFFTPKTQSNPSCTFPSPLCSLLGGAVRYGPPRAFSPLFPDALLTPVANHPFVEAACCAAATSAPSCTLGRAHLCLRGLEILFNQTQGMVPLPPRLPPPRPPGEPAKQQWVHTKQPTHATPMRVGRSLP
jgi:hypothetical protein